MRHFDYFFVYYCFYLNKQYNLQFIAVFIQTNIIIQSNLFIFQTISIEIENAKTIMTRELALAGSGTVLRSQGLEQCSHDLENCQGLELYSQDLEPCSKGLELLHTLHRLLQCSFLNVHNTSFSKKIAIKSIYIYVL